MFWVLQSGVLAQRPTPHCRNKLQSCPFSILALATCSCTCHLVQQWLQQSSGGSGTLVLHAQRLALLQNLVYNTIPFFELRVPVSQSEHSLLAVHSLSISTFLHPCRDYPELRMHASIHLPMCFLPRAFTCLLGFSICSLVHHQTHAAG